MTNRKTAALPGAVWILAPGNALLGTRARGWPRAIVVSGADQMPRPKNAGNRFDVLDLARHDPRNCVIERQRKNIEEFALITRDAGETQIPRDEKFDAFIGIADRGKQAAEGSPVVRFVTGFFFEFALGSEERCLA